MFSLPMATIEQDHSLQYKKVTQKCLSDPLSSVAPKMDAVILKESGDQDLGVALCLQFSQAPPPPPRLSRTFSPDPGEPASH